MAYLIAFAFEMLWILESSVPLPTAAILLCAGYFTLALFAALLIHGLATVSIRFKVININSFSLNRKKNVHHMVKSCNKNF